MKDSDMDIIPYDMTKESKTIICFTTKHHIRDTLSQDTHVMINVDHGRG